MLSTQVASNLLPRLFALGVIGTHVGSQIAVGVEALGKDDHQKTAARVAQVFFATVSFVATLAIHQVRLPIIALTSIACFTALIIPLITMDQDIHQLNDFQKDALLVANVVLDILTKFVNIAIFVASLSLAHVSATVITFVGCGLLALNLAPTLRSII